MKFSARTTIVSLLMAAALPCAVRAQLKAGVGDWPAWMGPNRTGVSDEKGLLKQWPKNGPQLTWKITDVGDGYSTPSVAGGKIFLMSNHGIENEYVLALDAKDGSQVWSTRVGKVGKPDQRPDYKGSRCTPTVDGDSVYVLGSDGDLTCLEAEKGAIRWTRNVRVLFNGKPGIWAYSESPLIDGDTLVCTPGGDKATLAAFNKKTGETIWKTVLDLGQVKGPMGPAMAGNTAAYASPIAITVGGLKMYVQFLHGGLVGVNAKDGKELFQYKGVTGITNCTTPLFHDECVFVSAAGYGKTPTTGCALLKLSIEGNGVAVKQVYHNADLANHHGGVVRVGDYVYGTNSTELLCVDFKTGETKWRDRSVGKGSIAAADGLLYVRSESAKGATALVEATPSAYKELSRFEQPDRSKKPSYPHPVIAGGRLYLRDQNVLLCYDLKDK